MSPKKPNQGGGKGRPDNNRKDRRDRRGQSQAGSGRSKGRDERQHSGSRRGGDGYRRKEGAGGEKRKSIAAVPAGDLPRWVREEITRTAPKERREPALIHLSKAVEEFSSERFGAAREHLRRAKDLAPQAATIRELLGLSSYHTERWEEALRELRTFRRISGEASQMPVEMDCLRALGRPEDVARTYKQFQMTDHYPEADDEARVVYASDLLDRGLVSEAWNVIKPGRLIANPRPSLLRRWYVAARIARAAGDADAAGKFVAAIADVDPEFPGLDEIR